MSKQIRVGLIGTGGYQQGATVPKLLELPQAVIAALCDDTPAQIASCKKRYPVLASVAEFGDYRRMIREAGLDAVAISTPHTLHYPQIMDCLGAGLHVLCDKPMVCSVKHARAVCDKVKKSRRVFTISYQRHTLPPFIYMREQVQNGAIGDVRYVNAYQTQNWLQLTRGKWRQSLKLSGGGQLNDSGSHLVDAILWIVGQPVVEVSAWCDNLGTEVDINSAVKMKFANGALGTMAVVGDAQVFWEDLNIVGTKGTLIYRNNTLTHITGVGAPKLTVEFPPQTTNPIRNFIECIQDKKAVNLIPPIWGLRVMELTEAAWRSAAAGGKVVKVNYSKA